MRKATHVEPNESPRLSYCTSQWVLLQREQTVRLVLSIKGEVGGLVGGGTKTTPFEEKDFSQVAVLKISRHI